MVRKNRLLAIAVSPELYDAPEIKELLRLGHVIECVDLPYDIIFHENAWRMTPDLLKHVNTAVKAKRAVKYPKKEDTTNE